jgi:hypothetical protein
MISIQRGGRLSPALALKFIAELTALAALAGCGSATSVTQTNSSAAVNSAVAAAPAAATPAAHTPTAPAPAVTLSANPSTVNNGSASSLSWSATNATSCTASGGWSGSQAISGSESTSALNATTAYTLSCTGTGGTTVQSATVTVTASTTAPSGTATLSWVPPTENTDGTSVTTLTGYHIYYGTTEGALTQSIAASGATTTSYEISGLSSGTWYFAVAADAADGTESAQSDVGSKTI